VPVVRVTLWEPFLNAAKYTSIPRGFAMTQKVPTLGKSGLPLGVIPIPCG